MQEGRQRRCKESLKLCVWKRGFCACFPCRWLHSVHSHCASLQAIARSRRDFDAAIAEEDRESAAWYELHFHPYHRAAVELERRAEEEHQAALRVAARASVQEPKVLQRHHDAALHILPMAFVHQNMLQLPRRPIIQVPFFGLHKFIPFRSTHPAGCGVSSELPKYSQLT